MIRIEDGVEVDAPAEDAFAFVTRIDDYPAWLPGVLRAEATGRPGTPPAPAAPAGPAAPAEIATGGPRPRGDDPGPGAGAPGPAAGAPAMGDGFRLVSGGPGGMEIVSNGRVEAVDPPRSIAISASSGFFALTAECTVTALDAARSRIAVRAAIEPRGLATLAAGRIEKELRASVPDTLRRLRESVEGRSA